MFKQQMHRALGKKIDKGGKTGNKGKKLSKKEKEAARKAGKRDENSDSEYSYTSFVSEGGTRHVRRRRKRGDGTYSASESYHSSQDEEGEARRRRRRKARDGSGDSDNGSGAAGSDSDSTDYSYASETSEGGTRYEVKRKRIRDSEGNVIGYGEKKLVSDDMSEIPRRGSIADGKSVINRVARDFNDTRVKLPGGDGDANNGDQLAVEEIASVIGEEEEWPGKKLDRVPSDFSDATTDDENVDFSKMTEEEKKEYLAKRELRRKERERRRRAKYGDKYDDIMKKREQKKLEQLAKEEMDRLEKEKEDKQRRLSLRRNSTSLSQKGKREVPKSMVTYEKGVPRDYGHKQEHDNRDIGLSHDSWGKQEKDGKRWRKAVDDIPKLYRESSHLNKLPPIQQGRIFQDGGKGTKSMGDTSTTRTDSDEDESSSGFEMKGKDEDSSSMDESGGKRRIHKEPILEVGPDGKLRLHKKTIDLKDLDADTLRKLGIDPTLSAREIAKKLKEMFGNDVKLTIGGKVIGTKHVDEFGSDIDDDKLAMMEDLDVTTLKGKRRMNVLFKRGGSALARHLEQILKDCSLLDTNRNKYSLDELESSIDFLTHYRLVDPMKAELYAKAFVVEDEDFDTRIDLEALKVALEGIDGTSTLTEKQRDYVMKVLQIDDATEVTFRMFAVISALCERVTSMDSLSQHLLEICELADVERKLELYRKMFYHNVPSYRNNNYITSESLTIEMMAGGLNPVQRGFVQEKLEPNLYGEISFIDYMCYIPLFLSLHDNICDNPLDMSDQKYQKPPRKRPPSAQGDMNPLGHPLKKTSVHMTRAKAKDLMEGKLDETILSKEEVVKLQKYAKLPDISAVIRQKTNLTSSGSETTIDLIY